MRHEGRIWPKDDDKQPLTTVFHVPTSPLIGGEENDIPGTARIVITETPTEVDERLREEFPLYRAVKFGRNLIAKGSSYEV